MYTESQFTIVRKQQECKQRNNNDNNCIRIYLMCDITISMISFNKKELFCLQQCLLSVLGMKSRVISSSQRILSHPIKNNSLHTESQFTIVQQETTRGYDNKSNALKDQNVLKGQDIHLSSKQIIHQQKLFCLQQCLLFLFSE